MQDKIAIANLRFDSANATTGIKRVESSPLLKSSRTQIEKQMPRTSLPLTSMCMCKEGSNSLKSTG